jgi:enoyl-CoA hydratase/carnithine racemase
MTHDFATGAMAASVLRGVGDGGLKPEGRSQPVAQRLRRRHGGGSWAWPRRASNFQRGTRLAQTICAAFPFEGLVLAEPEAVQAGPVAATAAADGLAPRGEGTDASADVSEAEHAMSDDLGTPHLRFERRGPLGWCVIDRPEARNALTSRMYFGIRRAVDIVNNDPDLHALIITGVGDVFCPGGDLRRDVQSADSAAGAVDVGELVGIDILPFKAIRQSRAPVVSAVNGICQGGGLTIAMLSDITVASERATFRGPELLRGITDTFYAQIMPAHIGVALTRDLMFTGRRLNAEEAVRHGLVSRMAPHAELEAAAEQAAREILQSAPDARREFKRIVNAAYGAFDEVTFAASLGGAECREGMDAFVEKRSPNWVPAAYQAKQRL